MSTRFQQQLKVFQSMWGMENLLSGGETASYEERLLQIAAAGFDGFTDHYYDRDHVSRLASTFQPLGLLAEGQVFPATVEELAPALENGCEFGCHHITIQADFRPRSLKEAIHVIEGWQRLAEQVNFPVLVETHRYRVTNDLLFTLDLLDEMPNLKLLSDLSHYVVAREFPLPPTEVDDQQIKTILDHGWGFHGRVSNGHQVQVPIRFGQHASWVNIFRRWWAYGMASWQRRAAPTDTLTFTCELGPAPYAITGSDGLDITDRWEEALMLKEFAETAWKEAIDSNVV
ncbi:hypothetical protein [Leeia oryzae]|uniref:hypothetical protein n=1 Tax=Leeia oryzae TaxID=356662 RepID=UPI00035C77A1|nr:hypothetical protein [Leeia oryzae]